MIKVNELKKEEMIMFVENQLYEEKEDEKCLKEIIKKKKEEENEKDQSNVLDDKEMNVLKQVEKVFEEEEFVLNDQ